jgi:alkylated DNA repair dioxygenase AlkB
MEAIVCLGATRVFALRPRGGGKSLRLQHHHGDLLVMGGSCQRTWEHCIPKTVKPVGPRISIQFRPHDVR